MLKINNECEIINFFPLSLYDFCRFIERFFLITHSKGNTREKRYERRMRKRSLKLCRFEDRIPLVIIHWAESCVAIPFLSVRLKKERTGKGGLINGLSLLRLLDKLSQGVHSPYTFRRDSRNIPNALGDISTFASAPSSLILIRL